MSKGVRLNPKHDEKTRAKIQTSQIINRLEQLVKGEITMTSQQVRAAEILLRKTLPDLQTVEYHSPEEREPLQIIIKHINGRSRSIPMLDKNPSGLSTQKG